MDKWIYNVVMNNISKGKIAKNEAEIYEYGYTLMIEKMIIFVICAIIALLLKAVWEVFALCITFIALRIYSGGYHAKSRLGCMILSSLILVLGVYLGRLFSLFFNIQTFIIIEAICGLFLIGLAPVDVAQHKLSSSEQRFCKRVVLVVFTIEALLGGTIFYYGEIEYAVIIVFSNCINVCSLVSEQLYKHIKSDKLGI